MTLEQLRVFVAVAERQHMTQAATALNLAQSAASAAIAALEMRHGTKLFNRVGRGIELTEAGRLFLVEARAVIARADAAENMLAELGGLKRGTLSIHASQTISSYWLPRHLVAFRRAHPGVEIRLDIGNTTQVAAAIQDGTAELGFVEGDIEGSAFSVQRVAGDQLVIVVGMEHPWVQSPPTSFADLTGSEWVLREAGSGTRSMFEHALEAAEISLDVSLELPSNEAVRAAVEAGMGATAISASVAAPSLEAGLLHMIALDLPERDFCVVRHRQRALSKAAEALLGLIMPRPAPGSAQG